MVAKIPVISAKRWRPICRVYGAIGWATTGLFAGLRMSVSLYWFWQLAIGEKFIIEIEIVARKMEMFVRDAETCFRFFFCVKNLLIFFKFTKEKSV